MARSRNIKPGFYKNEDLAECSVWARLIFPGLWMLADREGRLEDRPKRIKAELLPFDREDVDKLLDELARKGFIVRYRNSDGSFIQISKFLDHQSPHYSEKPSAIKGPEFPESGGDDGGNTPGVDPSLRGGRNPLIPDSLIPDSPNPEKQHPTVTKNTGPVSEPCGAPPPDGGKATPPPGVDPAVAAAVDVLRVGLAAGTAEHEHAGQLWGVLAANGCKGTAAHPAVIEMAREGVTVAELRAAIAEARKTQDGPLNPAYLAAIVERLRTSPAKGNGKAAAWATDDSALEAKAKELGMWPTRASSYHELRVLVRDRIAKHAQEAVR